MMVTGSLVFFDRDAVHLIGTRCMCVTECAIHRVLSRW